MPGARIRSIAWQILLVAVLLAAGGYAVTNLLHNLESRSITIGFSYLAQEAGFDISESLVAYDPSHSYGQAFVVGLLNTLMVSFLAMLAAAVLGLLIGIARLSSNWLLQRAAGLYVESVRNVPLLLQLLLWYGAITELLPAVDGALHFGGVFLSQRGIAIPWPVAGGWSMPVAEGFNFEGGKIISPEFIALLLGLAIYTAAFIAEIVRGGILAVSRGQVNAALALGMSRSQVLRFVVLPQAMRVILPPLTSQFLNLTKNSSLAVVIGYPDLVSISNTTLNQTGQALEAMGLMMLVYLTISLLISGLMNWYNHRVKLVAR